MENPPIYTSAPRPPKQIRMEENLVETPIEKPETPEQKETEPSKITIMQPAVSNNRVVKLNTKNETEANINQSQIKKIPDNIPPQTDELFKISPIADIETTPDFTDNKQIVTIEEPAAVVELVDEKPESNIEDIDSIDEKKDGLEIKQLLITGPTHVSADSVIDIEELPNLEKKSAENQIQLTNSVHTSSNAATTTTKTKGKQEEIAVEETYNIEFKTNIEESNKHLLTEKLLAEPVKASLEPKKIADKSAKSFTKSKTNAEHEFENLKIPGDDELFQRQYYTMGEVAIMFNANQSQIRFWENEFDILQPKKNKKGDRYFRPEDVKNLQVIHHLLRNRRFTIEGAREYLKLNKQRTQDAVSAITSLGQLKLFLVELKANL